MLRDERDLLNHTSHGFWCRKVSNINLSDRSLALGVIFYERKHVPVDLLFTGFFRPYWTVSMDLSPFDEEGRWHLLCCLRFRAGTTLLHLV